MARASCQLTEIEGFEVLKLLRRQREELERRLTAIQKDVGRRLDADSSEQVVELENAPVLDELAREAEEELSKITSAMARLESGTYGACTDCMAEIPRARLRAYPSAARCMNCEGLAENS